MKLYDTKEEMLYHAKNLREMARTSDSRPARDWWLGTAILLETESEKNEMKISKAEQKYSPIHEEGGQWYYWIETWADRMGPFSSQKEAESDLIKYDIWLNTGYRPD